MDCIRCGREDKIEHHHIKAHIEGGGDELENKEDRCSVCHDYEHARREIIKSIQSWEEKLERTYKLSRRLDIRARLELLRHRLEVLEALNTPEQIRLTGKYTSYWQDKTTHQAVPISKDDERQVIEMAEQSKLL